MGRLISVMLALFGLLGCGPIYLPAIYQLERPLLFPPDPDRNAWAAGANFISGRSLNTDSSSLTCLTAGAGYCLGMPSRWLSLRASVLGYGGSIREETVYGVGGIFEPALNIPFGRVLSLSLLGELGGAFEFGPYSRHFNSPVFPTIGVGAGVTIHPSRTSHLVLDARVFPGTVRVGYLSPTWGIHASVGGRRVSIGMSYLLGEEPAAQRRR
ncbi:hypothetical protein HRbin21_00862 [bacterium HR21]|nr:hypothetical protein HRbin21_00862 [bacterium HR21]